MSKNISQIYDSNPATSMEDNDLLYLGRDPYSSTDDFAINFTDFNNSISWNSSKKVSSLGVGLGNATPKFRVTATGLPTIPNNAITVVPFNSVIYDNYGFFNPSTFAFQPLISGVYSIYASMYLRFLNTDPTGSYITLAITRNNVSISTAVAYYNQSYGEIALGLNVSDLVQMNGSTDVLNLRIYQTAAGARSVTFTPITGGVNTSCIMTGTLQL